MSVELTITGIVQGVGFRPFVHGLATRLGLRGSVRNISGSVRIDLEGPADRIRSFLSSLEQSPPSLSRIDAIREARKAPHGYSSFTIEASSAEGRPEIHVSPDIAVCANCLAETLEPANRRYRYPFTNCVNCGPRASIVEDSPYDRCRTSMRGFELCGACREEYTDPRDRRFHAEPIACARCGPKLEWRDSEGRALGSADPIGEAARALRGGAIVAVKGLGGYHLACSAASEAVVAGLRRRKHRDEKPFAVMVRDLAEARMLCDVSAAESDLLASREAPIVLLRAKPGSGVAPSVSLASPNLGVMLPYTPLHHLLLRALGDLPLVLTSGNRAGQPIAYRDDAALESLRGIADFFLTHDRPIVRRYDDSVVQADPARPKRVRFFRRARGYAPGALRLPFECPRPLLALGAQLKNTFALGSGGNCVLSQHMGDLDELSVYREYRAEIDRMEKLLRIAPDALVVDLHPDYASTRYARERASRDGSRIVAVQHHHAHVASCMAENGVEGEAIGVAFDGTGYGTDGRIWGGEFLVASYASFERAAHLAYLPMPSGEMAIREPWRMAVAYLRAAGLDTGILAPRVDASGLRLLARALEARVNCPATSSMGRLFDAVASILGVRDRASYEGQAAIELEWLAMKARDRAIELEPFELVAGAECLEIRAEEVIRSMIRSRERGIAIEELAAAFHRAVAGMIAETCARVRQARGSSRVALSGGVFMNALLLSEAQARLKQAGFEVFSHRRVPANDGGISLGQLAIGAARLVAPA